MSEEKLNKYIARLTKEWREHSKIVISVDFDDTLMHWNLDNEDDIKRTIKLVQQARETGAYIVIFTASASERHEEILKYCESIKIPVDSINKNPIDLPYGNHGKIYYNINLCDRSGLLESLDILETSMYNQRSYIAQGQYRKLNDVA